MVDHCVHSDYIRDSGKDRIPTHTSQVTLLAYCITKNKPERNRYPRSHCHTKSENRSFSSPLSVFIYMYVDISMWYLVFHMLRAYS